MRKYYSELENLLVKANNSRLTSLVQELLLDNRDYGLENERLKEEQNYLSTFIDPITGLYNKNLLSKISNCSSLFLLCIDNLDNYDESEKKEILRNVSTILFNNTRQIDFLCRYSEKEFLIAFIQCDLEIAANRLYEIKNLIQGSMDSIKISVGGSVVNPKDSLDIAINRANEAKNLGDNNPKIKFYK